MAAEETDEQKAFREMCDKYKVTKRKNVNLESQVGARKSTGRNQRTYKPSARTVQKKRRGARVEWGGAQRRGTGESKVNAKRGKGRKKGWERGGKSVICRAEGCQPEMSKKRGGQGNDFGQSEMEKPDGALVT